MLSVADTDGTSVVGSDVISSPVEDRGTTVVGSADVAGKVVLDTKIVGSIPLAVGSIDDMSTFEVAVCITGLGVLAGKDICEGITDGRNGVIVGDGINGDIRDDDTAGLTAGIVVICVGIPVVVNNGTEVETDVPGTSEPIGSGDPSTDVAETPIDVTGAPEVDGATRDVPGV